MTYLEPQRNDIGQGTAGSTDVVTALQGVIRQLSSLVKIFLGKNAFGTFTLAAAASTVVPQPAVQGNSIISFSATNASAATLQGSAKALYYTISPGVSFTVFTASGAAAAGGEQFSYEVRTP